NAPKAASRLTTPGRRTAAEPLTARMTQPLQPPAARAATSIPELARRLQDGARRLEAQFLGKEEIIRLLFISAVAGEHMVMVGPPGTAKSALVRSFADTIDARYYDYLLTRFTEPN